MIVPRLMETKTCLSLNIFLKVKEGTMFRRGREVTRME